MAELHVLLLVIFYFVCVAELFAALVVRLFLNCLVSCVIIVLTMAELHVLLLVIFCLVCVAELFAALVVRLFKIVWFRV